MFSVVHFRFFICTLHTKLCRCFCERTKAKVSAGLRNACRQPQCICHKTQNHAKDTVPYWLMNRRLGLSCYKKPGFESVIGTAAIYDNVLG